LKAGIKESEADIEAALIQSVRTTIGPVAAFKRAIEVERLPKTRSGKILRKIMRAIADKKTFNPPSTIEDISVLKELEIMMKQKSVGSLGR